MKRKLLGTSTLHIEEPSANKNARSSSQMAGGHKRHDEMIFPQHVKVEHKFKGTDSNITNKVMETWINETLEDAYHMEIPGVLVQPENKNPIHRYGIDRQTLVNAGISSEEVDRIYRSLFVYSVGFFELLRKILSATSKNYALITSIWKVY